MYWPVAVSFRATSPSPDPRVNSLPAHDFLQSERAVLQNFTPLLCIILYGLRLNIQGCNQWTMLNPVFFMKYTEGTEDEAKRSVISGENIRSGGR